MNIASLTLTSVLSLAPVPAFAVSGFSIDDLVSANTLAVKAFQKDHSEHAQHFTGFKTWKSGDDAKVKIYVNHDGMAMEYNYLCHKGEAGTECLSQ